MENFLWMLPPMAAGLLVLASHISLGRQVLKRGIVFIDLAIAQTGAVGVLVGESLGFGVLVGPIFAACFAIAGATLVACLGRAWPARREALIGLLYVATAVITVFWISADGHGAQRVSSLLSGDLLWTSWSALLPLAGATMAFWVLQLSRADAMGFDKYFYPAFAILVSLSVPLLGLYLVFVSLIVPALWIEKTGSVAGSTAIAGSAYVSGILLSFWFDSPTGATVVLLLIATGLPSGLLYLVKQVHRS